MYFASYREIMGLAEEEAQLPEGSTVEMLMETVKRLHETLRDVRRMLVAVNGVFAEPGAKLKDGDVVAVFPPVSGG